MNEAWGLQSKPLTATMLVTHCNEGILQKVQDKIHSFKTDDQLSVTLKGDLMICRFLGQQAEKTRKLFTHLWAVVRPEVLGHEITIPRIWNT